MHPPRSDHRRFDELSTEFVANGLASWSGLLRTHARVTRSLDERLAASHGLALSEYEVLLRLWLHDGRMRMTELAAAALISRSGMTRMVDELESLGLVAREPDRYDGRGYVAALTPLGEERLLAARAAHVANVHELYLDALSPEQRAQLAAIWDAIDAALPADADGARTTRRRRRRRVASPSGR